MMDGKIRLRNSNYQSYPGREVSALVQDQNQSMEKWAWVWGRLSGALWSWVVGWWESWCQILGSCKWRSSSGRPACTPSPL